MRPLLLLLVACLLLGCAGQPRAAESEAGETDAGSLAAEELPSESAPPPEAGRDAAPERVEEPSRELRRALAGRPAVAETPRQLARQLRAAEGTLARPDATREELAAAGHLQQVAYLELGPRPAWDDRVRALLPASLHRVVADNVASRREFLRLHGNARLRELPAWRIVDPAPAEELRAHYRAAERRFGVEWEYLAAINLVETGMGRIRGYSSAGARGPMQFIPETWARYGRGDIDDPRDAIMAAARYLSARGFTEPGGRADALYAYNNARTYVRGVTLLAEIMKRRPTAYAGYYHWQIYYQTARGAVLIPQGYAERERVPLERWLRTDEGRSGLPFRATPR